MRTEVRQAAGGPARALPFAGHGTETRAAGAPARVTATNRLQTTETSHLLAAGLEEHALALDVRAPAEVADLIGHVEAARSRP